MAFPKRKHPPNGVLESETGPTIVFLRVCTAWRASWLANHAIHESLVSIWWSATYWKVGPYILMPNHLHLFAWPGILNADLDGWVRYWKSQLSNTIGNRQYLTTPKRATRQIGGGVFVGSCDLARPPGKPRLRRSFALPRRAFPRRSATYFNAYGVNPGLCFPGHFGAGLSGGMTGANHLQCG